MGLGFSSYSEREKKKSLGNNVSFSMQRGFQQDAY